MPKRRPDHHTLDSAVIDRWRGVLDELKGAIETRAWVEVDPRIETEDGQAAEHYLKEDADWFDFTLGWFLAKGVPLTDAWVLSMYAYDDCQYWDGLGAYE